MKRTPSPDGVPELFSRALELEGEERHQFVEEVAGRDPAQAGELRRLLDRAGDPDSPLDRSPWSAWADLTPHTNGSGTAESLEGMETGPPVPQRIGPYRIERELGQGGMGRVFLAEESTADFSRRLALKIIDRPLAGGEALRRFREELRILSLLEHPGIARFLHGGQSPEGIWYLALEYVDGVDLVTWAAERELDRDARVRLFLAVLEPVRYAHERGVVHRDLKPRHLLIDRQGRPRLLDFGISKLLDPSSAANVAVTRTGSRALTPAYASPEQFRGEPVSPATDVFALGIVLYELLAGRRPFDRATGSSVAFERAVLDTEPEPPSAALRGASRLSGVGRDLDAICLKALRKAPAERYADAGELAADLERYLAGQPVTARRGGWRRAVGRAFRRSPLGLLSAAAVLVAVGGLIFIQASRDRLTRDSATALQAAAAPQPSRFPFARLATLDIAQLEGDFAARPSSLPSGALLALALDQKRRLPEAKLIAARLRQIPGAAGDPLLEYVDATLANSSEEPQRALVLFTAARDGAIAGGRGELVGQIRAARGRLLSTLGERAEAYREMDLARLDFEAAGDFESLSRVLNDLAIEHLIRGELAQGQGLLERAIAAAERAGTSPTLMLHNLGQLAIFRGDPARADRLLRQAVAARRREGNPFRVGEVLASYAEALDDLGRRGEAIASLDEALVLLRAAEDKSALVATLYLRGTIAVSAGDLGRIEAIAAELEGCGTQTGGFLGLSCAYALRGFWGEARGDGTAMRRQFDAAVELAVTKGQLDFAAAFEAAHARAEWRAGEPAAAERAARLALTRLSAGSATTAPMAVAESVLARIDAAAGRIRPAEDRLQRFGSDAERSSSVARRLVLLAAGAAIDRASGRVDAAERALASAIELARKSGRKFDEIDLRLQRLEDPGAFRSRAERVAEAGELFESASRLGFDGLARRAADSREAREAREARKKPSG